MVAQADGFAYVRVEASSGTGTFSITGQNQGSWPVLSVGETRSGEQLPHYWSARWYQVAVSAGDHVAAILNKDASIYTYLSIAEGVLPARGPQYSYQDQAVDMVAQADGFAYVRVEASSGTGTFSIAILEVSSQSLTPGVPYTGTFTECGQSAVFRVDTIAGRHLSISLTKPASWDSCLSVAFNRIPLLDSDAMTCGAAQTQLLDVPITEAGPYFILLESGTTAPCSGDYTISVQADDVPSLPLTLGTTTSVSLPSGTSLLFDIYLDQDGLLFVTSRQTQNGNCMLRLYDEEGVIKELSGYGDLLLSLPTLTAGNYLLEVSGYGSGMLYADTQLPDLQLGEWTVGTIYRQNGSAWYQVNVPEGQASLFFRVETIGLYSQLKVYHGAFDSTPVGTASGNNIDLEIPDPEPGMYYVHLTDSAWIQSDDQRRDHMIKADTVPVEAPDCTGPVITSFSPTVVGTSGPVTIRIFGQCLDQAASVCLRRQGDEDIWASEIAIDSQREILFATFDLSLAQQEQRELLVIDSEHHSTSAGSSLSIETGGRALVWSEIQGRGMIRAEREATYVLRFGNTGSIDVHDCFLWLTPPDSTSILGIDPVIGLSAMNAPPGVNLLPAVSGSSLCIWVSKLAAGSVAQIPFKIRGDKLGSFNISVDFIVSEDSDSEIGKTQSAAKGSGVLWDWHPAGTTPPIGSIVVRLSVGHGVGHVGIYVGDGYFVDLIPISGENSPYGVRYGDLHSLWTENREGTYLGAGSPKGQSPALGQRIAEEALARRLETGTYSIPPVDLPNFDARDCVEFVLEVFNAAGYPLDWWDTSSPALLYEEMSGSMWPDTGIGYAVAPSYWRSVLERLVTLPLFPFIVVDSVSPEDKYGPTGYDSPGVGQSLPKHWISRGRPIDYRVDFWNKATAPAATLDVVITDQLDANLDWATFEFGQVGFLDWQADIEPCQYFNVDIEDVQIDLSAYYPGAPVVDLVVNVEGTFDPETGQIEWRFHTMDPFTRDYPEEPVAGFLPPITDSGWEIGWVNYSVAPKANLASGTAIQNQAWVKFDTNDFNPAPPNPDSEIPGTGPWVNTLDAAPPSSAVSPLPETSVTALFEVSWTGQDDPNGSGIAAHDIYVSDNGGPWNVWLANETQTSASFTGENGHTYGFYSVAVDHVGYRETAPAQADVTTHLDIQIETPNVAAMTRAAAESAIASAGLTMGAVTEVYSDSVAAGSVISQDPQAGASVAPGTAVALVVSKGSEPHSSGCSGGSLDNKTPTRFGGVYADAMLIALVSAGLLIGCHRNLIRRVRVRCKFEQPTP
jgi:hypothetical protein